RQSRAVAPNSTYSSWIFCNASGSTAPILTDGRDDERYRGAEREGGDAQRPAAADVAEVVDAEVDAREADQGGEDDPADDDRRPPGHAGAEPHHDRHRQPEVEGRVGGVGTGKGGAGGVDEAATRARPVDEVLDLVDADEDHHHAREQDAELGPAAAGDEQGRGDEGERADDGEGAEVGEGPGEVREPA